MSYVELMLDQGEITPIDWAGKKMVFDIFKADDHINIMTILYRDFTDSIFVFWQGPQGVGNLSACFMKTDTASSASDTTRTSTLNPFPPMEDFEVLNFCFVWNLTELTVISVLSNRNLQVLNFWYSFHIIIKTS